MTSCLPVSGRPGMRDSFSNGCRVALEVLVQEKSLTPPEPSPGPDVTLAPRRQAGRQLGVQRGTWGGAETVAASPRFMAVHVAPEPAAGGSKGSGSQSQLPVEPPPVGEGKKWNSGTEGCRGDSGGWMGRSVLAPAERGSAGIKETGDPGGRVSEQTVAGGLLTTVSGGARVPPRVGVRGVTEQGGRSTAPSHRVASDTLPPVWGAEGQVEGTGPLLCGRGECGTEAAGAWERFLDRVSGQTWFRTDAVGWTVVPAPCSLPRQNCMATPSALWSAQWSVPPLNFP